MYVVEIRGWEERSEIEKAFTKMIMGGLKKYTRLFIEKRDGENKDGKHGTKINAQVHIKN